MHRGLDWLVSLPTAVQSTTENQGRVFGPPPIHNNDSRSPLSIVNASPATLKPTLKEPRIHYLLRYYIRYTSIVVQRGHPYCYLVVSQEA
jgi:hypothetical protein